MIQKRKMRHKGAVRFFAALLCAALALSLMPAGTLAAPDTRDEPGAEGVSVWVQAVDDAGGRPLQNLIAPFFINILNAGNRVIREQSIRTESVEIPALTPGSYTLQVSISPVGYAPLGDILFTVGEDGSLNTEATVTKDGVLLIPVAFPHEEHKGEAVHQDWTAWNNSDSLPDSPGYYYLATNVNMESSWTVPRGTLNLCLNGCSINAGNGSHQIIVPEGAALTLYDESENSGRISGYKGAGGVVTVEAGGVFTMNGGSITGNTGAGVNVEPYGTFLVSGSPVVTENKTEGGKVQNVVLNSGPDGKLPVIQFAGPLTKDAKLGVLPAPYMQNTVSCPAVFTDGLGWGGKNPNGSAANFISDDTAYVLRVNDGGEAELTEATQVSVRKDWEDIDNAPQKRPQSIEVQLYADGREQGSPVTLNEENDWSYSWSELTKYANESGQTGGRRAIEYTVAEKTIPEGYVGEVTGSAEAGFVITNTFEIEKTQVSVEKVWDDNDNAPQKRPQSIEVQLYAYGEALGSPVTLNEENGWSYSWSDLTKYVYEGGQRAIEYTVAEKTIPESYVSEVTGSAETGFVITNIFVFEKTQVSVRNDWEDNNDKAQKRPQSIEVQLYADGLALGSPVTLDEKNGWSYSWSELKKYVYEGGLRAIAYTVHETEIPVGYVGEVTGSAETGFVITNTSETGKLIIDKEFDIAPWDPFIPDDSPVDVPVIMTWNDNNNKDGNRPESVVVKLLSNGTEVAYAELNAGNNWRYTFTGMPRLDENKEKIEYTITENPIDWYKDQISGFNIRNNYEPELTGVTVKKIWDDADNVTGTRPESIAMTLSNGMTVLLNDKNGWTATVSGLPTRVNGEPVNYTWTEQKVPGYDKISEVTEGTLTTFVNKRRVQSASPTVDRIEYEFGEYEIPLRAGLCESAAPTVSITAGVEWDGDDDYQSMRPESVRLILMGDGEPAGEPKTVKAPLWEAAWDDLPAQNTDGDPIEYTVKQMGTLSAYTTTCSDLTVKNTLKTGSLSVRVSLDGVPEGADLSGLKLFVDGPDPLMKKTLTYADVKNGTVNLGRVLEGAYMIRDTNADTLIEGYVMDAENSKVADAVYVSGDEDSELEFRYAWKLPEPPDEEADENYDPLADIGNLSFEILGPDVLIPLTIHYSEFTKGRYEIPDLTPGVYTVVERNAETLVKYYTLTSDSTTGLTVEVKAGGSAFAKLFNQYVPLPTPEPDAEFVDIPVTVTWNDNNNADGNRHESVTARLYADGVEVDSHVLTAAENWQFTFVEKPRHQEDNKTEIVYTVGEDAVAMYAATVNGCNIVNDYQPEVTSAAVSKVWNDNDNENNLRPDSIAMSLSDGQRVVKVVVLSEANGWSAAVNDLPTVVNGQAAQYEWTEQQVIGYSPEGVTQEGDLTIFTNKVLERPGGWPPTGTCTVTFDVNGRGDPVADVSVTVGEPVQRPDDPTADGFRFVGWYAEPECVNAYDFSAPVTADVTLYAKWTARSSGGIGGGGGGGSSSVNNPIGTGTFEGGSVKLSTEGARAGSTVTITVTPDAGYRTDRVSVVDKNGSAVPVAQNDDGTYRFTMPSSPVTVTPAFEKIADLPDTDVCDKFRDVSEDAWYHDAVRWAVDNGIMNGVASDLFSPDGTATRAMVVTMLWRLEGEPAGAGISFADVPADAWYIDAVRWAAQTGIIRGLSDESFEPDAPVTREQLAAILYRYAQSKGQGFTGAWAFPLDYPDAADVSEYAYEPLCWMTMHGIITGMDDGSLAPKDNATRAQIAAIFMRFCEETGR